MSEDKRLGAVQARRWAVFIRRGEASTAGECRRRKRLSRLVQRSVDVFQYHIGTVLTETYLGVVIGSWFLRAEDAAAQLKQPVLHVARAIAQILNRSMRRVSSPASSRAAFDIDVLRAGVNVVVTGASGMLGAHIVEVRHPFSYDVYRICTRPSQLPPLPPPTLPHPSSSITHSYLSPRAA